MQSVLSQNDALELQAISIRLKKAKTKRPPPHNRQTDQTYDWNVPPTDQKTPARLAYSSVNTDSRGNRDFGSLALKSSPL
ncbi:MAG: hypothetical protein JWQ10_305 [Herbaspirillum sp.]|nr:hypothetical protein [Herbaspirillum sp.]